MEPFYTIKASSKIALDMIISTFLYTEEDLCLYARISYQLYPITWKQPNLVASTLFKSFEDAPCKFKN